MPYVTTFKNRAEDLQPEKLQQRLELLKCLKRKGPFLELFAGRGFLSKVYADYASELILVDENREYLDEAKAKLGEFPHQLFCKKNIDFIREDLPQIHDLVFVDFDAFGSPAEQIKAFFENFKVEKPLLIAVTDGSGLDLGWKSKNYLMFERSLRNYFLPRARRTLIFPRTIVIVFMNNLLLQIGIKYDLKVIKINEFVRSRNFPVYLGYLVQLIFAACDDVKCVLSPFNTRSVHFLCTCNKLLVLSLPLP